MPFADASFDLVTCLDVLEHTPDDVLTLTELGRVTRPGGRVLATEFCWREPPTEEAKEAPTWGIFGVAESELHLLPDDLAGKDAIELGCGTAYVSCWLARRGARVVVRESLAEARRHGSRSSLERRLDHGIVCAHPIDRHRNVAFDVAHPGDQVIDGQRSHRATFDARQPRRHAHRRLAHRYRAPS
jgi:2-polyprenyl-3-methyl-5-hydroxy-6-metoxy-1,4-benzoquinol methylase